MIYLLQTQVYKDMDKLQFFVLLPSVPMVSSLCFTCSAIILLIDIRLSVMLPLVSTRLSLVAFLRQIYKQSQMLQVFFQCRGTAYSTIQQNSNSMLFNLVIWNKKPFFFLNILIIWVVYQKSK